MTAVAADLSDHGSLVASVFNFFSLPLVQSNPSLLWNSQSTKFGSSINIFPDRRSLTEVMRWFNITPNEGLDVLFGGNKFNYFRCFSP